MKYHLSFSIEENVDALYDAIKVEKIDRERSSLEITKQKSKLFVEIKARDATALRATFDGIIKLIIVFEKMKDGVK